MTTSDGQYLLICQKRDEGRQLYTLNLHNGEIRQITEGDGVGQDSAMFSHDDKSHLLSAKATAFNAMDAQTLEIALLLRNTRRLERFCTWHEQ
mgnify:CR=1 FL=1